ncbi:hypothetical protein K3495_g7658 [Podosphaera aphanis]|nr:hypothetical protein K3495_g7658 [Podosphaera aphanis]
MDQTTIFPADSMKYDIYGAAQSRKQAQNRGARAWNKEEEVYLLQTRLQKIPYKHIAAHLRKTELACRLHYHQMIHGSRRKKASSVPSSSTPGSPNMEQSRSSSPVIRSVQMSPPSHPSHYHYSPTMNDVQSSPSDVSRSEFLTPRAFSGPSFNILLEPHQSNKSRATPTNSSPLYPVTDMHSGQVNLERLSNVYQKHRTSFWNVVASGYGVGASPSVLEESFTRANKGNVLPTPGTPMDENMRYQSAYSNNQSYPTQVRSATSSETTNGCSISALLGIDANPRSPKERELIKKLEQSRNIFS